MLKYEFDSVVDSVNTAGENLINSNFFKNISSVYNKSEAKKKN